MANHDHDGIVCLALAARLLQSLVDVRMALHHDQPAQWHALYRYIGVTTHIAERAWQHKTGAIPGFTKTYGLTRLVYIETHDSIGEAIRREKTLTTWRRAWKVRLIANSNPRWDDLHDSLLA